jgi:hypothetical protein
MFLKSKSSFSLKVEAIFDFMTEQKRDLLKVITACCGLYELKRNPSF